MNGMNEWTQEGTSDEWFWELSSLKMYCVNHEK